MNPEVRILFTKMGIEQEVKTVLPSTLLCDFQPMIKVNILAMQPIDLKNSLLIFTSINGAKGFIQNHFNVGGNPILCVGSKTEQLLSQNGFKVNHTAKNAEALAEYIINNLSQSDNLIHFCGNKVLPTLEEKLSAKGYHYHKTTVYETELLKPQLTKTYDAIAFFSPSGVESFMANNTLDNARLFAIGTTTAAALKQYTDQPIITSSQQTLESMLMDIQDYINTN
ncbi:uroporphyrinogen-III synthase [Riemerella columbina]|uniref:uroporphyrinogen-III synthase n=1 Tax=Riemerella columbina TaxID=103810 RepID=UPI00037A710B|nr:uroporphyrinogen-III synthase [Riemerella columbina]